MGWGDRADENGSRGTVWGLEVIEFLEGNGDLDKEHGR